MCSFGVKATNCIRKLIFGIASPQISGYLARLSLLLAYVARLFKGLGSTFCLMTVMGTLVICGRSGCLEIDVDVAE
jgi:hypothetical protein